MKKLLMIIAALVGLTTASVANEAELSRIEKITPVLMEFIAKNTDYDVTKVPPVTTYVFKTPKELSQIYYGNDDEQSFNVEALYSDGVVFLSDSFTVREKAYILLHELVHHAQFHSGKAFECVSAIEREAYDLMDKYVVLTGNGTLTDPVFKMFLQCRPEMDIR